MATYLTWPDWMPKPQHGSYSIQPEERRAITDMDSGSVMRVEFDTDENTASCSLVLDTIQAAWFEAFEHSVLRQGSAWFSFPLWIGGEISYELCRFKERPAAGNLIGLHTTYTFSLQVSERSRLISDEAALTLLDYGIDWLMNGEADELAASLHTALHVHLAALEFLP